MSKAVYIGLWPLLFLVSCVKDKPSPKSNTLTENSRILVANEGVFGNGNATFSLIDPMQKTIANNLDIGGNAFLGDVFQSIKKYEGHYYFIINNSSKILVIDTGSFQKAGQINVPQPRYMVSYGDKAFVSSLYHHSVFVLDLKSRQIIDTIHTENRNNEGLLLDEDELYICPWDTQSNYIYRVNAINTNHVQKVFIAGKAPQQVIKDRNGMLWVIAGNKALHTNATITQIDPGTNGMLRSFQLPVGAEIIKPVFNPTKDTLYYIGVDYDGNNQYNGVFRMSIYGNEIPQTPFISAQNLQYYWGLGIDHRTGLIYVGDPKGFLQSGAINVYDEQGTLQHSYQSGLGPAFFYFD